MIVYLLFVGMDYEGMELKSVHSTLEAANVARETRQRLPGYHVDIVELDCVALTFRELPHGKK